MVRDKGKIRLWETYLQNYESLNMNEVQGTSSNGRKPQIRKHSVYICGNGFGFSTMTFSTFFCKQEETYYVQPLPTSQK